MYRVLANENAAFLVAALPVSFVGHLCLHNLVTSDSFSEADRKVYSYRRFVADDTQCHNPANF